MTPSYGFSFLIKKLVLCDSKIVGVAKKKLDIFLIKIIFDNKLRENKYLNMR